MLPSRVEQYITEKVQHDQSFLKRVWAIHANNFINVFEV